MGIQDLFTLVFVIIPCAFWLTASRADSTSNLPEKPSPSRSSALLQTDGCFDFSNPIMQLLRPRRISKLASASGRAKDSSSGDEYWAMTQGNSSSSITQLYDYLSDRNSTRSSRVDKMNVITEQDPHFLLKQKARYEVDPFPLITVSWIEEWTFSLLKGTAQKPEKILASYEKIEGTSHIKHLCGNILLEAEHDKTHITLYEEAEATGRSQEDTLNGLKGTLRLLQGPAPTGAAR